MPCDANENTLLCPQNAPETPQIYFLLVRIKIKHMEMAIIRRETAGTGSNQYNESETIIKYEVMDGAPAKGERKLTPKKCLTVSSFLRCSPHALVLTDP